MRVLSMLSPQKPLQHGARLPHLLLLARKRDLVAVREDLHVQLAPDRLHVLVAHAEERHELIHAVHDHNVLILICELTVHSLSSFLRRTPERLRSLMPAA